ncbi:MAG: hypothetical protein Q3M30_17080 [Candidatus Electrothrix sp. Rat3]|nr:hypothetical protein [Candidatus Electrothrix rattekaaiensis]
MEQIQEISSWITYGKVAGNRISVDLPKGFDAQEVQIIIIPKKKVSRPARDGWKKDFQSISQWDISEDDINVSSWPITEF